MYTTIIHPLRKAYNLSLNEYVVLDTIYHLSRNNKNGGWCIKSKKNIALDLDLSERTVFTIINTLFDKGLIEKGDTGIRTNDEWNELISNKSDYSIMGNNLIHKQGMQNLQSVGNNCIEGMQNLQSDYAEIAYNNNIYNNIYNNISKDILETKVSQATDLVIQEEEKTYGNKEINDTLSFLAKSVGVDTFKESHQWQRNYGKNFISYINKIGKEDFIFRLKGVLQDEFKSKNCNSLKYLYNEIKSFIHTPVIEKEKKNRTIII